MLEQVRKDYFIPKLSEEISKYISECLHCLAVKQKKRPITSSLPTSQPPHPWETLQADLVGPLTTSADENVYIQSVINTFTRWCELRPIKNRRAVSVAEALLEIFYVRGLPKNITFDNAKELQSDMMHNMLKSIGIHTQRICPYRPQSNRMVEALNKRIKTKL